LKYIGLTVW